MVLYSTPHTLFTPPLNNEARHVQYIRIFDPVENMGNFSMQYDDQSWQTDYYPYANYTLSMYYQPPSTNYHVPATGETKKTGMRKTIITPTNLIMVQIGPSKERVSRADVILLVEDAILVQMERKYT